MKRSHFTAVSLALAVVWMLGPPVPAGAGQEEDAIRIPPGTHEKAIAALKDLGPGRGALDLSYKVLDIEGIIALGLTGRSEKIKAALKDLGAEETDTDFLIELEGDILFDFDKWSIREDAEETLGKVGEVIEAYGHPVTIIGHTDSKGSGSYNLELSGRRAASVKDWLVKNSGIEAGLIETDGRGESEPAAPNAQPDGSDNPEGRQRNRRVEIRIRK